MSFNKRVAFYTLGCKVNQYETESIKNQLLKKGYTETAFEEEAEVYIVNSCTVTSVADRKTRNMLRRAKKINPRGIVIVTGCYAQTNSKELLEMKEIDYVIGNTDKNAIVNFIEDIENRTMEKVKNHNIFLDNEYTEYEFATLREMSRAYVKIQDGCNNFCTYCIIPYARGRVRSRQKESVLNQAQRLVDNGYVEIVLTGIHTAGYGEDLDDYSFYELLVDLVKIKGLKRLRISSIETSQISDEIIDLIGSNEIIVDHLHVPLQAGSDATLKRMNRKYTTAEYLEKINKIRSYLPNIAFTTDVIVGFPGETDEEFEETYNFIKQVNYSELHVFPYSPRKNTPAAKMKGQVNDQIKHERANRLLQLSKELNHEFALKQIGKTLKVLFEKRDGEYLIGHAGDYLKVKVKTADNLIGEIVTIKIDKYDEILEGRVV